MTAVYTKARGFVSARRLRYDAGPEMEQRDGQIWLDGDMVPWREARVHVLTHTLHYGMGVFEGIRAYETRRGPAVFRLQEHVCRLFRSAHILGMKIPWTPAQLSQACVDAVRVNGLRSAYIRPMCFLDGEGMGLRADHLRVRAMVAAWPWDTYLGEQALEGGIRVKTSSFSRHHVNSAMCKAKANGYYINSMLALQEALAEGCEEALMLDTAGFVAEGSGENIFIVRDGELSTRRIPASWRGSPATRFCSWPAKRVCAPGSGASPAMRYTWLTRRSLPAPRRR